MEVPVRTLIAIHCLCLALLLLAPGSVLSDSEAPSMRIEPPSYTLAPVFEGAPLLVRFTVSNGGKSPLQIKNVTHA